MDLKDQLPRGMVLPHRSPDPVDIWVVRQMTQRAKAAGFCNLWVTGDTNV